MGTLAGLLRAQDGLVRLGQLEALGISRSALRWRLRRGQWRSVLPGVYLAGGGTLSERQRMLAAQLYGGQAALLTGAAAVRMHGVRYAPREPVVRVLVPHERQVASYSFARIHRTTRPDPWPRYWPPVRLCSPARAIADAARWCRDTRVVRAMVADAIQRGIATVVELRRELDSGPQNHSALLRATLDAVSDGIRSAPEAELRDLLKKSTILPRVRWNLRLVSSDGRPLPTPDGWVEEVGLAIEVDSREFHISPEDWERTLARHNALAEYGVLVLHFPPSRIRRDPGGVLYEVEHAYLERLRGRARASVRTADP